jgi:hypothetical protein
MKILGGMPASPRVESEDRRITAFKQFQIGDRDAHDLIIRASDVGVCSNRLIPAVLHELREPRYQTFELRNVWSLFNSFTEALHGLLDVAVGLN